MGHYYTSNFEKRDIRLAALDSQSAIEAMKRVVKNDV